MEGVVLHAQSQKRAKPENVTNCYNPVNPIKCPRGVAFYEREFHLEPTE